MDEMQEIVQEFLVESREALDAVENDLIVLEQDPQDLEAVRRIFRAVHTIKGTCGFIGLDKLERVTHVGESLLARVRDGEMRFTEAIASALLTMVDAVRAMLDAVERTGTDGDNDYADLVAELQRLRESGGAPSAQAHGSDAGEPSPEGERAAEEPPSAPHVESSASTDAPAEPGGGGSREGAAAVSPVDGAKKEPAARPPQEAEAQGGSVSAGGGTAQSTEFIRVDVRLLDTLMNLVGELVLTRNQILQITSDLDHTEVSRAVRRLDLITRELQQEFMKTRMQPISNVWGKFPRVVRDLCRSSGKKVRVEMVGQETELDRSLIEAIRDPLTHLVRNAIDHGVEPPEKRRAAGKPEEGVLALHASHEGGHVIIEVRDDGAGIPLEKVARKAVDRGLVTEEQVAQMGPADLTRLIFLPGLSTAEKVTKISGRGVGMDVVKTNIEGMGGSIDLETTPGKGTTFRIQLPLTLAIMPALIVVCRGQRFAIPQASVAELIGLESEQQGIEYIHGAPVYRLRGALLPLAYLSEVLRLGEADGGEHVVVIRSERRRFGLVVDEVLATQEIVVKPLSRLLKGVPEYAGCTIMGDGRVVVILDVLGIAQRARMLEETAQRIAAMEERELIAEEAADEDRWLLIESVDAGRMAVPLQHVVRLEELDAAEIHRAGDRLMAPYRDGILEVRHIADLLEERRRRRRTSQKQDGKQNGRGRLPVIVYRSGGEEKGVAVERILDIVPSAPITGPATRMGVRGTVVVQERVTELLDVDHLIRALEG